MLEQSRDDLYLRALHHRSDAVVAATDDGSVIRQAAALAALGQMVIPARVVHALVQRSQRLTTMLDPDDWSLLTMLREHMDATAIAAATGCSERTVYRRLRRLYQLLQVSGRHEAISLARRLGDAPAAGNTSPRPA